MVALASAGEGFLVEAEDFEGVEIVESIDQGGTEPADGKWTRHPPGERKAVNFSGGWGVAGDKLAHATKNVEIPRAGTYNVWALIGISAKAEPGLAIKIRQGSQEHHLEFNKATEIPQTEQAASSGHSYLAWVSTSEVALTAGSAELTLVRGEDPGRMVQRLLRVDALYFSPDPEFRPNFESEQRGGVLVLGR
jgi:hypothetical protein